MRDLLYIFSVDTDEPILTLPGKERKRKNCKIKPNWVSPDLLLTIPGVTQMLLVQTLCCIPSLLLITDLRRLLSLNIWPELCLTLRLLSYRKVINFNLFWQSVHPWRVVWESSSPPSLEIDLYCKYVQNLEKSQTVNNKDLTKPYFVTCLFLQRNIWTFLSSTTWNIQRRRFLGAGVWTRTAFFWQSFALCSIQDWTIVKHCKPFYLHTVCFQPML